MLILLSILLIGTLLGTLIANLFPGIDPDSWQFALISLHALIVIFYLLLKGGRYKNLIIIGFILRLALMICNFNNLFPIPGDGIDTENFHRYSVANAFHGGNYDYTHYTDFLVMLYRICGVPGRWLAQYINVVLGVGVILAVKKTADFLGSPAKVKRNALLIVSLLPHLIIFSAILLREMWIICSIAYSAYWFVKWASTKKLKYAVLSSGFVLLGAYMHSGVILILIGYVMAFLFLNLKTFRTKISIGKILIVGIAIFAAVAFSSFSDIFLDKFSTAENIDDVLEYRNKISEGGSAYLTWINSNSVGQMLLYSPLLILYFILSPMVFAIRNVADVAALLLNTFIFLGLFLVIFWKYFRYRHHDFFKGVTKYLIIAFMCGIFVMSLGTKASGVALRHRMKVFPVMVASYLVIGTGTYNMKNNKIINQRNYGNGQTPTQT